MYNLNGHIVFNQCPVEPPVIRITETPREAYLRGVKDGLHRAGLSGDDLECAMLDFYRQDELPPCMRKD